MITLLDNTVMSNFAVVQRSDPLRIAFGGTLTTSQRALLMNGKRVSVWALPKRTLD